MLIQEATDDANLVGNFFSRKLLDAYLTLGENVPWLGFLALIINNLWLVELHII